MVGILAGRTGRQLALIDSSVGGIPLLEYMSLPQSPHVKAIMLFSKRVAYANTQNDRTVPFCTAMFTPSNPFKHYNPNKVAWSGGGIPPMDTPSKPRVTKKRTSYPHIARVVSPREGGGEGGEERAFKDAGDCSETMRDMGFEEVRTPKPVGGLSRVFSAKLVYSVVFVALMPFLLLLLLVLRYFSLKREREESESIDNAQAELHRAVKETLPKVKATTITRADAKATSLKKKTKKKKGPRESFLKIAANMRQMRFERIAVCLPGPNTHPVIVGRKPLGVLANEAGLHVVRHIVDHLVAPNAGVAGGSGASEKAKQDGESGVVVAETKDGR
eukprot:CAMPEP_0184487876 /NCGR_PEP_ID=MMETSP0113_2-20130426/10389_1 /TAXON_ID=91329 /ORGANISM="Norrisiella sphaerica, Strain BC52" /LENGTH=330 /DNA_ID=CAMNT_0026870305 /DNA_START=113 /DNA_END=1105 /DNA_ORIENTATION=-